MMFVIIQWSWVSSRRAIVSVINQTTLPLPNNDFIRSSVHHLSRGKQFANIDFFLSFCVVSASMAGNQDQKWQKDAADQNFDYMFKLLIIGNSSVGKTSFLFRYADDSFTSAFVSTVGIDFKVKTVFRNDKRVKLQIWVSFHR